MRILSGKQMCALLESRGWSRARVTGSHHVYIMKGSKLRITVPVHGNRDLKTGLQKAIMKMAEIREEDL